MPFFPFIFMNIQHKEHKRNHNCSGVSIAYCKHTRKSLLWVDDASHSLGRSSSWSLTIWAIMTGVIARPGDHTLAKCMKSAIYLELEASPVDGRRLLTAQVAFVDEGVRLCGILGGEDPSFLPLLTSFLNVRSQLRQATADGVDLDADCWRESCGQIDISLQPQDLTMAVLAYTNDQSAWLFARRATWCSERFVEIAVHYLNVNASVLRMVEIPQLKPLKAGLNQLTFAAFSLANSLSEDAYPLP